MALETAVTINQLDPANPAGPDRLAQGDDHIRLIKAALKNTFPNINAPVTISDEALNALAGLAVPVGAIQLWYGTAAACPTGYAICDGTTVALSAGGGTITTPDMRGRVPVGANATHAQGTTFGQDSKGITTAVAGAHDHGATTAAAGEHSHPVAIGGTALTVAQMPSHSHGLKVFDRSDTDAIGSGGAGDNTVSTGSAFTQGYVESVGGGQAHSHTGSATADGTHSHALNGAPDHAHAVTVDVTQASIALHYIMKI